MISVPLFGADELRLSIGEMKHLYFPGLKRVENMNKKLLRVRIYPNKDRVTVTALSKGSGKLHLQDRLGHRSLDVTVFGKLALDLEREVKEVTAHIEGIHVKTVGHQVVISGRVLTPSDYKTLKQIEKKYEKVLMLATPTPSASRIEMKKMIQVELKMIEINQNKLRGLGIQLPDSIKTHFSFQTGPSRTSPSRTGPSTATLHTSTQFDVIFQALEKKGLLKILANPKLIVKNGAEAEFLAGGEIPIRLSNEHSLSVQWKPYGIRLRISPEADDHHQISVTISVEISSLNAAQSVEGIPSLLTRKLKTSFNVRDGETIVLSGLIQQEQSENIRQVPGLSSLPIIGPLFRSTAFQNRESELMIFVTPTIRQPKSKEYPL